MTGGKKTIGTYTQANLYTHLPLQKCDKGTTQSKRANSEDVTDDSSAFSALGANFSVFHIYVHMFVFIFTNLKTLANMYNILYFRKTHSQMIMHTQILGTQIAVHKSQHVIHLNI